MLKLGWRAGAFRADMFPLTSELSDSVAPLLQIRRRAHATSSDGWLRLGNIDAELACRRVKESPAKGPPAPKARGGGGFGATGFALSHSGRAFPGRLGRAPSSSAAGGAARSARSLRFRYSASSASVRLNTWPAASRSSSRVRPSRRSAATVSWKVWCSSSSRERSTGPLPARMRAPTPRASPRPRRAASAWLAGSMQAQTASGSGGEAGAGDQGHVVADAPGMRAQALPAADGRRTGWSARGRRRPWPPRPGPAPPWPWSAADAAPGRRPRRRSARPAAPRESSAKSEEGSPSALARAATRYNALAGRPARSWPRRWRCRARSSARAARRRGLAPSSETVGLISMITRGEPRATFRSGRRVARRWMGTAEGDGDVEGSGSSAGAARAAPHLRPRRPRCRSSSGHDPGGQRRGITRRSRSTARRWPAVRHGPSSPGAGRALASRGGQGRHGHPQCVARLGLAREQSVDRPGALHAGSLEALQIG